MPDPTTPNPDIAAELQQKLTAQIEIIKESQNYLTMNADLFTQLAEALKRGTNLEFDKAKQDLLDNLDALNKNLPESIQNINSQLDAAREQIEASGTEQQKKIFKELEKENTDFQNAFSEDLKKKTDALRKMNFSSDPNNYDQFLKEMQTVDVIETELKELQAKLKDFNDASQSMTDRIKNVARGAAGQAAGVVGAYAGAQMTGMNSVSGVVTVISGLSTSINSAKNIFSMFTGAVSSLHSDMILIEGATKSQLAYHEEFMQYYVKQGLKIKNDQYEFLNNLEEMKEKFSTDSGIGSSFKDLNDQLTVADNRLKSLDMNGVKARLYGEIGDNLIRKRINETAEIIQAMGPFADLMAKSVTNNVKESNEMLSDYYYRAKKLMNLSEDDILKLTTRAVSLGKSFPAVFHDLSKATKEAADKFNLDFKRMSKDVITLRNDIKNFAHKSSEDLAGTVAQIKRLGVSTEDAMSIFNKFNTFEDAATTAAQLSQSFGMVIDSMDLLKAESPDEMLQMYKDAFIASGKSFETMNRFERSLLIDQTGLSEQAAQALFSAQNAGKTYEEVMADIESQSVTVDQAEQMEKMDGSIQKTYKTMKDFKDMTTLTNDILEKQLLTNEKTAQSFKKIADNVEKTQSSLYNMGNALEKNAPELIKFYQTTGKDLDKTTKKYEKDIPKKLETGLRMGNAAIKGDIKTAQKEFSNLQKITKEQQKAALGFTGKNFSQVTQIAGNVIPAAEQAVIQNMQNPEDTLTPLLGQLAARFTPEQIELIQKSIGNIGNQTVEQVQKSLEQKVQEGKNSNPKEVIKNAVRVLVPQTSSNTDEEANSALTDEVPVKVKQPDTNTSPMKNNKTNESDGRKEKLDNAIKALQDALNESAALKKIDTQKTNIEPIQVAIHLDGTKLGQVLIKNNFASMLADPSLSGTHALLDANTVIYRNGQIQQGLG